MTDGKHKEIESIKADISSLKFFIVVFSILIGYLFCEITNKIPDKSSNSHLDCVLDNPAERWIDFKPSPFDSITSSLPDRTAKQLL